MPIVVIGNGPSRASVDLSSIPFFTVGCNALYRDFSPDILVAADKAMQEEILEAKYPGLKLFRRRKDMQYPNDPNIDFFLEKVASSGIKAARYSLNELNADLVYLIGFDFDRGGNIYAGTKNYRKTPAVNGVEQLERSVGNMKKVVWVNDSDSKYITNRMSIKEFLKAARSGV